MTTNLSRRAVLTGIAATAAAAVLPAAAPSQTASIFFGVDLASGPDMIAFAVGTPGESDWQHVTGRTVQEAIHNFMCERLGGDGCEDGGEDDCDCEWCSTIRGLEAERKPAWDGKASVTSADWLRIGAGVACSRCGYETDRDEGGHPIGDEAVCSGCMTSTEWDSVDPVRAAELRSEG